VTINGRQNLLEINFGLKNLFYKFYNKTKIPLAMLVFYFPVKLTTIVGEPIVYKEGRSIDDLVDITKESIEKIIIQNQKLPESIISALIERF
jgi:hypothetical protein